MRKTKQKPYKIIGAYDSETTNYKKAGCAIAFPILHQLGILDETPIIEIDASNVEDHTSISLYRHAFELYARLDAIAAASYDYVPVILCHNLAFDMYGLSQWLSRHNVRVLAKSARKPITFTICDEFKQPKLVIWDTLIFSQQSLERMGKDCGYTKGVGEWDYDLIRTPETPLTAAEIDYSKRDIYTLLAWLGWWLRRNPDILPEKLGLNVVTKTGVVRERRRVRFARKRGRGMKRDIEYYWLNRCRLDQPKSDDELFTMLAATRGGFTFCSSINASIPFNLENTNTIVAGYDATSQHPAQLVSHMYPYQFKERPAYVLDLAFECIGKVTLQRILSNWAKPFPVAFYACFEFENLRPKKGSFFDKYGIMPLASARYKTPEQIAQDEDNGDKAAYMEYMQQRLYCDTAENANCAFGKLVSASKARLYITELTAWEIWQCYEWDNVRAVHGYETGKFCRPSDMDIVSVMQFYKAKNEFKKARENYYNTGSITNGAKLIELGIAPAIVDEMEKGLISSGDIEGVYLSLKADLNSLFGISCSNQYRRNTIIDEAGITYTGNFGICNAPRTPKVWYQFGQRIVGWSRIAQICTMLLCDGYIDTCINGDTDSVKFVVKKENLDDIDKRISILSTAIDKGKTFVCNRVQVAFPDLYDDLQDIGHYVLEFKTDRFCAAWNKAYCIQSIGKDGKRHFSFTLAGIPTKKRVNDIFSFIGIDGYADRLYAMGKTFEDICNILLGYNVTFANDVIRLNARTFPEWGSMIVEHITDYRNEISLISEPAALALYPMSKTINDTRSNDNYVNSRYALTNNPNVNLKPKLVISKGIIDLTTI